MLSYLLVAILAVLVAIVARAQFNLWGSRPAVYGDLSLDKVVEYVHSWAPWLESGRIVVTHRDVSAEAELRKRRFASMPDVVVFRVRNADATRRHFQTIRSALDNSGVVYELELTRKTKQARAIAIELVAEDIHTPAAARKLLERIFPAVGASGTSFSVYVDGTMRIAPDVPNVRLIPWRQDHRTGFRLGAAFGRALRRILRTNGAA